MEIDTAFDFRSDTPPGKDPDTYSDTLRGYHRRLWSKPLPDGAPFKLEYTRPSPPFYLKWAEVPFAVVSSDALVPSFTRTSCARPTEKKIAAAVQDIPSGEREAFNTLGYTLGGMMIWPAYQINGKMTINVARGCHPRIKDRFDLTLECIRRYYEDPSNLENTYNPLAKTLALYAYFFILFRDFRGFIDFFLLQDLVTDDYSAVKFHAPFEQFKTYPFPESVEAYREYMNSASDFIRARNNRIVDSICIGNR